jgi:hypothetical protein
MVPGSPAQLRREPAAPQRRRGGDHRRSRRPGDGADHLGRPQPAGGPDPARTAGSRSRTGGPGGRPGPQRARSDHRHARIGLDRSPVVLVFPRLRSRRRRGPVRADRAEGPDRRRRLPVRRQADPTRAHPAGRARRAARGGAGGDHPLRRHTPRPRRCPGDRVGRPGTRRRRSADLRSTPFRLPAQHHVLVGDHRTAQEHRAPGRWGAPEAPLRAPAHFRYRTRGPHVLVHHLRVDDVELAHQHPGQRSHRRPLRRESGRPRPRGPVAPGRSGPDHSLRGQPQVPGHQCQGGDRAPRRRRPVVAALGGFDRGAAQSRAVRLGVSARRRRRGALFDHRRHRPGGGLRRWGADPPHPARRDLGPLAGGRPRLLRRRRELAHR